MRRTGSNRKEAANASLLAIGCIFTVEAVGRMPHSDRISAGNLMAAVCSVMYRAETRDFHIMAHFVQTLV